ncbi:MAG: Spy/CpxP family protein refolding chaperone [Gemmatimonadaceae bacterium]|nr:Spy/CpxP family protein refolding chaperone [Gloeobacterales cyanobacterium ES-bin-141]
MKQFVRVLILAALVLSPVAVLAGSPDGPRTGAPDGVRSPRAMRQFEQLNLSEQQKAQIQQIRQANRTENASLITQMESLRSQMNEAQAAGNTQKVDALKQEVAALKPQLREARQETQREIEAILTPEQQAKYRQLNERQNRRPSEATSGGRQSL